MTLAQRCAWLVQRNNRRRRQVAPGISALTELAGLLVEFQSNPGSMSLNGSQVMAWNNVAGSEAMTLNYQGGGFGPPLFTADALGSGRPAVNFRSGSMAAAVGWSYPDMTAVFVGNVDSDNLQVNHPRWLSMARYSVSEEDWNAADTWVTACYNCLDSNFVADRNGTSPVAIPFDPAKKYIIATRKSGDTITAWVKPFGEATATASGATDTVALVVDTFNVGGNQVQENLAGLIAHIGMWNRALTDAEVLAALNYLGGIYE